MTRLAPIRRRVDFLAVRGGLRSSAASFLLEAKLRVRDAARETAADSGPVARFGFTVTRKLGTAVVRNRIRRRLKAAFEAVADGRARDHFDYVVVARPPALRQPFAALRQDAQRALERIGAQAGERGPRQDTDRRKQV